MSPGLENKNVEFAFGRFRVNLQSSHPTHLLIVDCETRRFTIEQPSSIEDFYQWCHEVDHAVIAGRHIVCVPVSGSSIEEIQGLGTGLGYAFWPSMTILAPPITRQTDGSSQFATSSDAIRQDDNELRLRLLARVGII
jgi:hypothetical protein